MAGRSKLGWAPIRRRESLGSRGKGVGSEREPRRTHLRAWPGLGRPGRESPAGGSTAAEWWRAGTGLRRGRGAKEWSTNFRSTEGSYL
jgi:hypothetical protein